MDLFESLNRSILKNVERPAFFIDASYYTYQDLAKKISAIRLLLERYSDISERGVGLIYNDDLQTYAAIIAIWLEGRYYVPLNLQTPAERNGHIIRQAGLQLIISSSGPINLSSCIDIDSNNLPPTDIDLSPAKSSGEALAYTLFTSGSTGAPKGVPITLNNLSAFVGSYLRMGLNTNENDRWLQMFDLSFDLSVFSFLIPLLQGACIYTIPKNRIRNNYIVQLLDEHHLTVALMIPSVLQFLSSYFDEIDNKSLKYSLFCGEALPVDLIEKWSYCVPSAQIFNLYGPTEATIFCTAYTFKRHAPNKAKNGILSVGKPLYHTRAIIIDEENQIIMDGSTGELCLSGAQVTPGYLNNPDIHQSQFFEVNGPGGSERFYKTGDLCSIDQDGDILFNGRLDSQVKINGFRIELGEIEFHAKMFLNSINLIALTYTNEWNTVEIGLVIESPEFDALPLFEHLKRKLPSYMMPAAIRFEDPFPWNKNGKTDKKELLIRFLRK